jgi:hypothetical protein
MTISQPLRICHREPSLPRCSLPLQAFSQPQHRTQSSFLANHRRGSRVSWSVDYARPAEPMISLIVHDTVSAGGEVHNNYGAKPNSELILGYGFALSDNPDDTIVLRIGGGRGRHPASHEIGRHARGAEHLLADVLSQVQATSETCNTDESPSTFDDQLDAAETLGNMVQQSLDQLPTARVWQADSGLREDVCQMILAYVQGKLYSTVKHL